MRVALVSGQPDPRRCGVADYTRRLAVALRAAGAEVTVTTGRRWDVRDVAGVARRLRAAGPDVVHVQWAPPAYGRDGRAAGLLPALLGRGRRAPRLAVTVHEYGGWEWAPPFGARLGWHPEGGLLLPRARTVVTTNEQHAAMLAAAGFPAAVVPIGPNLDAPARTGDPADRERVRSALGVGPGAALVAFFGFVAPVKGVAELLEALALLRRGADAPRDVHLALAGGLDGLALGRDGGTAWRRELRGRIAALGLDGAVHVLGWRPADEVSRLLHAADAAALPFRGGVTRKSGSLLALLDHGVPTVVTPWSPPDPALADGGAVRVVPEGDPAALAAALAGLLDDPAGAARLAATGRALVAEHGWPAIARRHLELYAAPGRP